MRAFGILAMLLLLCGAPALAAQTGKGSVELEQAMQRMHADMMRVKMTGDLDHDFAAMMRAHHQGAVRMARVELARGREEKLRRMAIDTVRSQGREIERLTAWLRAHPAAARPSGRSPLLASATARMWREMHDMKPTGDVDHDFAAMMIAHHQGAIEMARAEVASGRSAELKAMAADIIVAQTAEIVELRIWMVAAGED